MSRVRLRERPAEGWGTVRGPCIYVEEMHWVMVGKVQGHGRPLSVVLKSPLFKRRASREVLAKT